MSNYARHPPSLCGLSLWDCKKLVHGIDHRAELQAQINATINTLLLIQNTLIAAFIRSYDSDCPPLRTKHRLHKRPTKPATAHVLLAYLQSFPPPQDKPAKLFFMEYGHTRNNKLW